MSEDVRRGGGGGSATGSFCINYKILTDKFKGSYYKVNYLSTASTIELAVSLVYYDLLNIICRVYK